METMTRGVILPGYSNGILLFLTYLNYSPYCFDKLSFKMFANGTNVFASSNKSETIDEFSLCQSDRSRTSRDTREKMEHFPIKAGQPIAMALTICYFLRK